MNGAKTKDLLVFDFICFYIYTNRVGLKTI